MHSIDKNYSPVSFGNFFVKNSVLTMNLFNLRNSDEYFIPRVDNESLRRFPFFDLPKCWNSLALNNPFGKYHNKLLLLQLQLKKL